MQHTTAHPAFTNARAPRAGAAAAAAAASAA